MRKRILHLLLALCMMMSLAACGQQAETPAPGETPQEQAQEQQDEPAAAYASAKDDYARAFEYGWVDNSYAARELDEQVTAQEYKAMMTALITDLAPEELDYFNSKVTNNDAPLTRNMATLMSWYAAKCIGAAETYNNLAFDNTRADGGDYWDTRNEPFNRLFPDCFDDSEPVITYSGKQKWNNEFTAGLIWNLWHCSPISKQQVVAFDEEAGSMRNHDPFTAEEAVCAVARLYDSVDASYLIANDDPRVTKLLADASARREEIRSTRSELVHSDAWIPGETYTGTAYYISPNGDDANDGLSPETAKKSIKAFMHNQDVRYGDAIFLERGGEWRIEHDGTFGWSTGADNFMVNEGVTIAAYGTGAKPIIRGDHAEGSDPAGWTLYYDQNGVKIWKFYKDIYDVNVIAFNEGEAYADKIFPYRDAAGNYVNQDFTPYVVENALSRDLTFSWLPPLIGYPTDFVLESSFISGPLYLRCDAGNPADVYASVNIPQISSGMNMNPNSVMMDLDVRFFTLLGAVMTNAPEGNSRLVENCEFSWCGGAAKEFQPLDGPFGVPGLNKAFASGGAIQMTDNGNILRNNYFHDCGVMTLIISIHGSSWGGTGASELNVTDVEISGNLFEHTATALHWADFAGMDNPGEKGYLSHIRFSDNMVFYSGDSWIDGLANQMNGGHYYWKSALENSMSASEFDDFLIENNVFYGSTYALLSLNATGWGGSDIGEYPTLSGNTYVQFLGNPFFRDEVVDDPTGTFLMIRG